MQKEKKYKIEVPHFYCLEYFDEGKKMKVEMDFRESYFVLSNKIITKWEPPHDNEIIDENKKKEILKNIYEFLLTKTIPSNIKMEEN
ncbi:hypothetical protein [Clostridium sp. KNHs205]|jgi:hypothetical protein|uniref:hypothetical protein n=1 Tax=Clostridium sp. KNHs205 TaxID=1449050 RepID=UPI00051B2C6F|nr:hypothetical protein [Clostridium sp. KNHs205]